MKINLNEIPTEGKSWMFNEKSGELNATLNELIGSGPYQADFSILPLATSGTYELRGSVKTQYPEQCSRCGIDFKHKVNEKFYYLLMPELDTPRDGKYSKPNHYSDLHEETIETTEYQGHHFDAAEFIHEIIALYEPLIPAPPLDDKEDCTECKLSMKNRTFSYDEGELPKANPFGALKGIKLN